MGAIVYCVFSQSQSMGQSMCPSCVRGVSAECPLMCQSKSNLHACPKHLLTQPGKFAHLPCSKRYDMSAFSEGDTPMQRDRSKDSDVHRCLRT